MPPWVKDNIRRKCTAFAGTRFADPFESGLTEALVTAQVALMEQFVERYIASLGHTLDDFYDAVRAQRDEPDASQGGRDARECMDVIFEMADLRVWITGIKARVRYRRLHPSPRPRRKISHLLEAILFCLRGISAPWPRRRRDPYTPRYFGRRRLRGISGPWPRRRDPYIHPAGTKNLRFWGGWTSRNWLCVFAKLELRTKRGQSARTPAPRRSRRSRRCSPSGASCAAG